MNAAGAEGVGHHRAVVGRVRRAELREAVRVLGPRELAGIDDDAAQAGAVAAHVLGQRVDDDVGAVLDRPAQGRRGDRAVHHQRHAGGMRDGRHAGQVRHVAARVADGLAEHQLGLAVDGGAQRVQVVVIHEARLDAELRQRVGEQVVGAAVEFLGGNDVVAGPRQVHHRVGDGRRAGGQRQRRDAAFQRRHALFEHVVGRVHDAGVDVARDFQVEQVGAVLGAVEGVGNGLVDRHRDRLGGRIGLVAGVDGEGFEFHRGDSGACCGPAGLAGHGGAGLYHRPFRAPRDLAMQYSPLGRTGLQVSRLCLGTMTFGEQNSEAEAHAQLDYATAQGVNFIDAAEMYPVPPRRETQGRTEAYIGSWLKARGGRDKLIVATKVAGRSTELAYARPFADPPGPAQHRGGRRGQPAAPADRLHRSVPGALAGPQHQLLRPAGLPAPAAGGRGADRGDAGGARRSGARRQGAPRRHQQRDAVGPDALPGARRAARAAARGVHPEPVQPAEPRVRDRPRRDRAARAGRPAGLLAAGHGRADRQIPPRRPAARRAA